MCLSNKLPITLVFGHQIIQTTSIFNLDRHGRRQCSRYDKEEVNALARCFLLGTSSMNSNVTGAGDVVEVKKTIATFN